ncbi:hypothetical protein M408DRAFT_329595 [Serendipita vermifera MAFF 305830]|uniref:Cytochrome P450 n=1 Tax=Serendipita vermifera MAFF 305830 TaxID=933852 RepID=A0A0C3B7Z9_SERVB|nr:hypothetical protein M408DRAFT_329595 [Serendipita vermifera MAFF 305830]
MPSMGVSILWTLALLVAVPIIKLVSILVKPYFSNLRDLPGPPGGSWVTGHISELNRSETDRAECHLNWLKEYGHVFVYKSLLNSDRLTTVDTKALNHILASPMVYYKPSHLRLTLGQLIGEGLIFAEGAAHKRQRRVMNPTFSLGNIRQMTAIFMTKALELRDSISHHIATQGEDPLDAIPYVSRCTLDIVGLAGFNYDFNTVKDGVTSRGTSMGESTDELARAFSQSYRTDAGYATIQLLMAWIPPLRWVMFDKVTVASDQAQKTMRRIGKRLVREKKRALGFSVDEEKDDAKSHGTVFAREETKKDLLSLMIVANMSPDVAPEQKMTEVEVMHQIPTFMVAGHETTATALTWSLFLLATHKSIQSKLRRELATLGTDMPTMDELNSLPYFEAVLKESLRLYPSFENTLRIAQADDVIPLEKPFTDRKGRLQDRIRLKKGDGVFIPILVMNRLESIWGPDAAEFNPERWKDLPGEASTVPSVWGNQFTFLGGPRSCIGFRFAVMEMKAILYTLIRSFELELAVKEEDVLRTSAIVTRPMIRGQIEKGTQMPLIMRPVTV